jgi:hypothetical protein
MSVATPTPLGGRPEGITRYRQFSFCCSAYRSTDVLLTDFACAAFSSGDALGLNCRAAEPAFLLSSRMTLVASSPVTELLGSCAASMAPWDLSSFFSLSELMLGVETIDRPWSELPQIDGSICRGKTKEKRRGEEAQEPCHLCNFVQSLRYLSQD